MIRRVLLILAAPLLLPLVGVFTVIWVLGQARARRRDPHGWAADHEDGL